MGRDILGGGHDAYTFRSTTDREAVTPTQFDDVGDVAAIGGQTGKAVQGQYDLFESDWMISTVVPDARHSQYARLGRAKRQFCPLDGVRSVGGLCERLSVCHDQLSMAEASLPSAHLCTLSDNPTVG